MWRPKPNESQYHGCTKENEGKGVLCITSSRPTTSSNHALLRAVEPLARAPSVQVIDESDLCCQRPRASTFARGELDVRLHVAHRGYRGRMYQRSPAFGDILVVLVYRPVLQ